MSLLQSFDAFLSAGLRKNELLGKWEFFTSSNDVEDIDGAQSQSECVSQDHIVVEIDKMQLTSEQKVSSKSKRKNKKKKTNKSVHWGSVEEICFSRTISYCVVPNKGIFPLGLGDETQRSVCTVDELYSQQQTQLLELATKLGMIRHSRTQSLGSDPNIPSPQGSPVLNGGKGKRCRSGSTSSTTSIPPIMQITLPAVFETRQYDYKSSSNPLFRSTTEHERIEKLMVDKTEWNKLADTSHKETATANEIQVQKVQQHRHTQSSILDLINKDIKSIKASRDEAGGCSCKHVKIDKLSVVKLKSELLSKGHLIAYTGSSDDVNAMSKSELTEKVRDVLKHCVLCAENNCECYVMGIPCNALVCGCLRGLSHSHHPNQAKLCGNSHGYDQFDSQQVSAYRKTLLANTPPLPPIVVPVVPVMPAETEKVPKSGSNGKKKHH